eukprot:6174639-Karenia_brevis.AAC.1
MSDAELASDMQVNKAANSGKHSSQVSSHSYKTLPLLHVHGASWFDLSFGNDDDQHPGDDDLPSPG